MAQGSCEETRGRYIKEDQGSSPGKRRQSGRQDELGVDNGHENVKNPKQKRALVCHNCGGMGHPARLCPTPSDHATQAVDEEGDTDEESSEGEVCGVVQECALWCGEGSR